MEVKITKNLIKNYENDIKDLLKSFELNGKIFENFNKVQKKYKKLFKKDLLEHNKLKELSNNKQLNIFINFMLKDIYFKIKNSKNLKDKI